MSVEFFVDITFQQHCAPGVNSASNRNEYQEYFLGSKGGRCLGVTTLPLSYVEPQLPETLKVCLGL